MEAAIAIVALLFVLFVALGAYATAKAVGAAKRGVDRTVAQARRTVEDTTLRARGLAQPGAAGELAQLRMSLRTSMRATQQTLQAAASEDPSLAESLSLFERLSEHGHNLDDELKRLEREPDRARIAERLPDLRERTERIVHSADSLRWAAQDRARRFADDDLAALGGQIQMEAGALRHWDPVPDRTGAPEEAPGAPAAAPGAPAAAPGPGWGEPEEPPAITARDPQQGSGFPWDKSGRGRSAGSGEPRHTRQTEREPARRPRSAG